MSDNRPSDRSASALLALASVLLALSLITVMLRFYARRRQKAPILWDDWMTLPALIAFIGATSCLYFGVSLKAFGYSATDLTKEQVAATKERSAKAQLGLNFTSLFCLACSKASALLFYRRIFCVSGRKAILHRAIVATLVVLFLWLVAFELLIAFQCQGHLSALWDGTQLKYCTYSYPLLQGYAISDFLLDVWVLVLPIYPITELQTTKSRRFAIGGIFLLACIGVGSSIARMVIILQLVHLGQATVHSTDPLQYISRVTFYWVLEMGVSLVAINLPSIWLVFASVAPDAILRSICSAVSLASIRSRGSKGSKGSKGSRNRSNAEQHLKSRTSTSSLVPSTGASAEAEAYELRCSGQHRHADVPSGQIHVSHSVQQSTGTRHHEQV
ncbi:hypothetical protein QQS21_004251 [Conoideocrella luteorostrata]|uniref:Rhodopsin domain-containing protein n=1 Tax=Conoideocrella luteorostrata TaxID=1105319 RepID=A0AAJ0CU84_9HYPO|nr:hypothetical protein QQS21_004251 [Conoideocrella luteorostrata]